MTLLVVSTVSALALITTGCGSDIPDRPAPTPTTSSAPQDSTPPAPTVEELNAMLQRGLDPTIPASEKADLVEGSEADPELINRAAEVARNAGVKVTVTDVQSFGSGVANANVILTVNGQDNPSTVPLVFDSGKWKLQKSWACSIVVNLAQIQSPACP
ncbi:hypothetical protein [Nocardia ninae]|nr:hypothetical protein [Nocardia ninae]